MQNELTAHVRLKADLGGDTKNGSAHPILWVWILNHPSVQEAKEAVGDAALFLLL